MTIELQGIELFAHHGVLESERVEGQRFLVDLELEPANDTAAGSDRIEDAVDYREILAVVVEIGEGRRFDLLEALASELVDTLLERLPLVRARVRVRKPDVVLDRLVQHAAVVVERAV